MKRKGETPNPILTKKLKKNETPNNPDYLKKYDYKPFYANGIDNSLPKNASNETLTPNVSGSLLVADYYGIRYNCRIFFTASSCSDDESLSLFNLFDKIDFASIRKSGDNQRVAFLYGMDEIHAIPIIYIKEGNREGFLIADTHGESYTSMVIAENIHKKLGIKVFLIEKPRQADKYSCYTDALVFARDSTAFDAVKKEYYIPDLLAILFKRSYPAEEGVDYLLARLPDKLLKTSQISAFLTEHQELEQKAIHKDENLNDFRKRYTESFFTHSATSSSGTYTYPRQKGLKLATIIEIQYYLKQVEVILGHILSREEKLDFIARAKSLPHFAKDKKVLYEMTQNYISNYNPSLCNPK